MTVLNAADAVRLGSTAVDAIYLGGTKVWPAAVATTPVATLTVPAGRVASMLTNFVTRVDLSHMPDSWWAAHSFTDGRELRVRSGGIDIPFDLANFAFAFRAGELFFKATLTTGDNVFTVEVVAGATAPAVTDPIGRNAVWTDYDFVLAGDRVTNRTGTTAAVSTSGSTYGWAAVDVSPNVASHQGVATDADGNFYVIGNDGIKKYGPTWNLLATQAGVAAASGIAGVNHTGDGCVHNGELYTTLETYPDSPYDNVHVAVWNLTTLAFIRSYSIAAQAREAAGLCFNADDGYFYVASFVSGDGLDKYDTSFNFVSRVPFASAVGSAQGVTYVGGKFYLTSDATTTQRIYEVAADGSTVTPVYEIAYSASGTGNIEGIDSDGKGNLLVLWDTQSGGGSTLSHVRTYRRGWTGLSENGYLRVAGLPKRALWTMGASAVLERLNLNRVMLTYGVADNTNTNAAQLMASNTQSKFAIWNSTDLYLLDPGTAPASEIRARHRWHHTQNGTTDRKIWRDGALKATDTGTAQRPGGPGDNLYIGWGGVPANTDQYCGGLNYVYLRNGVLSANWLAAENASWETPASFYTITV